MIERIKGILCQVYVTKCTDRLPLGKIQRLPDFGRGLVADKSLRRRSRFCLVSQLTLRTKVFGGYWTKYGGFTMRYLMRLILVAVVFLVPVTSAQAERVLRLNEVAVGELDPHIALDYIDSILLVNLYDPLVRPKPGGGFLPGLAESWEVSDDNMSITFTVQSGIKFHDGSDVNADDVIYSFDRNKALGMGYAYLFANASMAKKSDMEALSKATGGNIVTNIDDLSVLQSIQKFEEIYSRVLF